MDADHFDYFRLPYILRRRFLTLLPQEPLFHLFQTSRELRNECEAAQRVPDKVDFSSLQLTVTLTSDGQFADLQAENNNQRFYFDNINLFLKKEITKLSLKFETNKVPNWKKLGDITFRTLNSRFNDSEDTEALITKIRPILSLFRFYNLEIDGYINNSDIIKIIYCPLYRNVTIRNLDGTKTIGLSDLQKRLNNSSLLTKLWPSKIVEIIQYIPNENCVNVLALERGSFVFHSYQQPPQIPGQPMKFVYNF